MTKRRKPSPGTRQPRPLRVSWCHRRLDLDQVRLHCTLLVGHEGPHRISEIACQELIRATAEQLRQRLEPDLQRLTRACHSLGPCWACPGGRPGWLCYGPYVSREDAPYVG